MEPSAPGETRDKNLMKIKNWSKTDMPGFHFLIIWLHHKVILQICTLSVFAYFKIILHIFFLKCKLNVQ